MGKLDSWATLALMVAIFIMVGGCSRGGIEDSALSGGDEELLSAGIDTQGTDSSDVDLTRGEGLKFDLIPAEAWIDTEVLPGSIHYFSYDPADFGEGTLVTWHSDTGYFVDSDGEYSSTIVTEPGDLVIWQAPDVSVQEEVEVRASGPEGWDEESFIVQVRSDAPAGRTEQPYFTSLRIDDGFGGEMEVAAGELLVSFGSDVDIGTCASVFSNLDVTPLAIVDEDESTYRVRISPDDDLLDARDEINSHPGVAFAEFNYICHLAMSVPDDEYWYYKWDLVRMNALDAWDIEDGSDQVVVAVIDTGVDLDHPDLAGRVIDGADFVSGGDGKGGEVSGDNIDNNFNGWVDENVGHGTHCAGIIGAVGYNGIGSIGINLDVTILPLRVFPVDGDGGASVSSICSAISYARSNGADVINLSLGSPHYSSTFNNAVTAAINDGLNVICAAGNSGVETVFYPAGYTGAVAVASINYQDKRSYFSNYGTWIDICAPGESIHSTYFNDHYVLMSGTSMASPQVAGVAALIRAYRPDLTGEEVRDTLINGADESVYDANPPSMDGKLGSGCLDALGALEYCGASGFLIDGNETGPEEGQMEEPGPGAITGF